MNILSLCDLRFNQFRVICFASRKDATLDIGFQPECIQFLHVPVAAIADETMFLVVMRGTNVIETVMEPVFIDAVQSRKFGIVRKIEVNGAVSLADDFVAFM